MYKILINKPSLPSIDDYIFELKNVWKDKMLSNFFQYVDRFELIAKNYLGARFVRAVGNADLALMLALSSLDLESGSEVILPSFTFNSTANAVRWNGLKTVFADINRRTLCIDSKDVEIRITDKTKVILATHVFGNPCDIKTLENLARKHNLNLLFDSAHAYGSIYQGKKIGSFGDAEIFSFNGTKIVTSAEGGIITTNNEGIYKKIGLSRNYGFINDYNTVRLGLNGKISELNAILGCLSLPKIEKYLFKRLTLANKYKKELSNKGDISFQLIEKGNRSNYQYFGILTNRRNQLSEYLRQEGIQTKKYFYPVHLMDCYKNNLNLPTTEYIAKRCLCIPLYNDMSASRQDYIIDRIIKFYKQ